MESFTLVRRLICLLLTLTFFACLAVAQSGTVGTLTGVVRDPNGANLPGASVVVKNLATSATRTAISNEEGHWPGTAQ